MAYSKWVVILLWAFSLCIAFVSIVHSFLFILLVFVVVVVNFSAIKLLNKSHTNFEYDHKVIRHSSTVKKKTEWMAPNFSNVYTNGFNGSNWSCKWKINVSNGTSIEKVFSTQFRVIVQSVFRNYKPFIAQYVCTIEKMDVI